MLTWIQSIVEAYTFNFQASRSEQWFDHVSFWIAQYYTVPGTDTTVPIMSLGDDLMKLSLGGLEATGPYY